MTTELKSKVGPAMGRLASGVYIVTTKADGKPDGMLATWIAQAAFEPPSIVLSVNLARPILKSLPEGGQFAVNVLSKNNMDIFKAFAKPGNDDKFEGLAMLDRSLPVFAQAVSYMVCKVSKIVDAGDHCLVIGEVVDGELLNQDEPMTHLRKDGFQY